VNGFGKGAVQLSSSSEAEPFPIPKSSPVIERWHKPAFILFLASWAVSFVFLCLGLNSPSERGWTEGPLLVSAALTSLLALGRRLPLQNVLMTAVMIALMSAGIMSVAALSGVPFGPYRYLEGVGDRIFEVLPWPLPLIWIVVIVNGRGVARLIMRPWRKTNYYGLWVIGLTCALAVVLDLGLEPFAVFVKGYWIWQVPKSVADWYTAPWVNFLGWFVAALSILAFTTPWLINKQPIKVPIDYHPLVVWLLINLWLATGNALHHLWAAVALSLGANAVVSIYAIRGARW